MVSYNIEMFTFCNSFLKINAIHNFYVSEILSEELKPTLTQTRSGRISKPSNEEKLSVDVNGLLKLNKKKGQEIHAAEQKLEESSLDAAMEIGLNDIDTILVENQALTRLTFVEMKFVCSAHCYL